MAGNVERRVVIRFLGLPSTCRRAQGERAGTMEASETDMPIRRCAGLQVITRSTAVRRSGPIASIIASNSV